MPSVVVVGAGAMGGWTALFLRQAGCDVTLVDQSEPGNAASSSGDDSRVLRHTYANPLFTRMAARARVLWQERQVRWKEEIYRETGLLWLVATEQDDLEKQGSANLAWAQIPHETVPVSLLRERFPWIETSDCRYGIWEAQAGFLRARLACQKVVQDFESLGGTWIQNRVVPFPRPVSRLETLPLQDGSKIRGDFFVFASGSWLKTLFPDLLEKALFPTRQEVHYFDLPETGPADSLVWADHGQDFWYGIVDRPSSTIKIACDSRGPSFDPQTDPRQPSQESLALAREKLARRFPTLALAPHRVSRVCHYENTPDHNLIFDRLPQLENAWLLGGGSGHGFKHGPALGESACATILSGGATIPQWSLSRF